MKQRSLTLILDNLKAHRSAESGEWPVMPVLQMLLSKGEQGKAYATSSEALLAYFNMPAETPVAAVSALGDGLEVDSGWWLRVDPVHMVADRDQLYLSAAEVIGLSRTEADALVAELNRFYEQDDWCFYVAAPQRWYLRLPEPLDLRTVPTARAMGRRVGEVLPEGGDALYWQRIMTEIQMLLHASPVNTERNDQGLLAVNSLWFWGGGAMPRTEDGVDWQRVVADEPLAMGLARLHDIDVGEALMPDADKELWQRNVRSPEAMETELLVPLHDRLRAGELDELVIELPGFGRWRIARKALRRWWRRRKPLASLLKGQE
jgi:hypothetical protein